MPTPAPDLAVGSTVAFNGKRYLVTLPAEHPEGEATEPILVEIVAPSQPGAYYPGQGNGTYLLILTANQEWFLVDSAAAPLSNPARKLTQLEVEAIPDLNAVLYFRDPS